MKMLFETESGSKYILDRDTMTWARPQAGEGSVYVRTTSGPLTNWPEITVGKPVQMFGPSLTPGGSFRWIYTTPVVSKTEL
jgi:hypothetical protein